MIRFIETILVNMRKKPTTNESMQNVFITHSIMMARNWTEELPFHDDLWCLMIYIYLFASDQKCSSSRFIISSVFISSSTWMNEYDEPYNLQWENSETMMMMMIILCEKNNIVEQ